MSSQSTGMDTDGEELNIGRNGMCDSKQFLNLSNGKETDKIKTETGTNLVQIENVMTGMATPMTASYPARIQVPHSEVKVEQMPELNLVPHHEINPVIHSKPKLALHHETKLTAIPKRKLLPHAKHPLVPRPEIKLVTHAESKQQLQFDMKLVRQPETNPESKQSGNKRRKLMLNPEVKQIPYPFVQQQPQSETSRIKFSENKQITHSENDIVHSKTNLAIQPGNNNVSQSVNNHVPLPEESVAPCSRYKQVPTCEIKQLYPDKKQLSPYIGTAMEAGAEIKQLLTHDIEKLPPRGIKHIQFAESKTFPHPVLLVTYNKGKQVTCRATHPEIEQKLAEETKQIPSQG